MSEKIETQFAVKSMSIMEKILTKLGFSISNNDGKQIITRCKSGYQITITEKGISFDSSSRNDINQIKIEYSKNVAIDDIETKGVLYTIEESADEIVFLVKG